jgi:glycerol-3-phosphate dehydrogenase
VAVTSRTEGKALPERATIVVIGAGVIGCSIAREATRYTPDVVILEKESDVADGTSKANNAEIHSGIGEKHGTLKARLNVRGNRMYDRFIEGLGVDFKRQGLLVVVTPRSLPEGFTSRIPGFVADRLLSEVVPRLIVRSGNRKGIGGLRIVGRDEMFRMEPNVTREAIVGVHDPNYGLVSPYKLTIALCENAIDNGASLHLNTEVTGVDVQGGRVIGVRTPRGYIKTGLVVNAAGVFADTVAEMAGVGSFKIHPRKGATLIFDREVTAEYVRGSVAEARLFEKKKSKGGGAMPTVEGNLQLGPTAVETDDKYDTSIEAHEIDEIFNRFHYLFPNFPREAVISAFSGVRAPTHEEDFVIDSPEAADGFVNAAGMQSPGLASAPAVAEEVLSLLHDLGLPGAEREGFVRERKVPVIFAHLERHEQEALIEREPRYGNIVCRCEHITEAEVVEAARGKVPATNMDALKRRTRVGMGRCQGGFCQPRVAAILARELGVPVTEVTKDGGGSHLFTGPAKKLLLGER